MHLKSLIQNHPLHPAFVHFPIACWTLSTMGDVTSLVYEDAWYVSGILLVIGTLTALFAMLSGLLELGKIEEHSQAMRIANLHMKLIMMTWCFYATSLLLRIEAGSLSKTSLFAISLSICGFVFLCVAGWFGASLVYKYRTGVKIIE